MIETLIYFVATKKLKQKKMQLFVQGCIYAANIK